jgi:hypothetical protein
MANFGGMAAEDFGQVADLHYSIDGQPAGGAHSLAEVLFLLEKDLTVDLQRSRPDLFFLHAAAVDWNGKACLLAGDSGHGKSTATWGLLHHGFSYLSDELGPVDVGRMEVLAYPHALCLKQPPPAGYALPAVTVQTERAFHVPVGAMPSPTVLAARPIGAIFLLRYEPGLKEPELSELRAAEAGARLYATALNALAHSGFGLDAALRIAQHVPCFALASADLTKTCALVRAAVEAADQ